MGARFRSTESSLLGLGGAGLGVGLGGGGLGGGGMGGLGGGGEDGDAHGDFEVPAGVNMGRRRSRAVLYQLSGHYKPEKIKTKLKLNNVSGDGKGIRNGSSSIATFFFLESSTFD